MTTYSLNTSGDLELNYGSSLKLNNPLGLAYGGLGADATISGNLGTIQSNLGLAIGTNVQQHASLLDEFAALSKVNNQVLGVNGSGALAYTAPSTYSAGASGGLALTGSAFSLNVDNSTLDINASNQVEIKSAGVGVSQVNSNVFDQITLQGGSGTSVSIKALPSNSVVSGSIASSAVGAGLTLSSGAVAVDPSVVCELTGNQTVGGLKVFTGKPNFEAGLAIQPSGNQSYGGFYEYELKTTDALNHALATIASDTNALMKIKGQVVGIDSTGLVYACYNVDASYTNISGTLSALNSNVAYLSNSDTVHISVSLAVSSTNILVNVQNSNSTVANMRWSGMLEVVSCNLYA